ncbi:MAG TPA: EAL domain-containing protein [Acidobacteriaceae bacterium]
MDTKTHTAGAMLTITYNPWLVLISVLVAMLASYTALDMAGRITAANGRVARWWLAGGSLAMGSGIWSMHFIGMLACHLPIAMGYDPWITGASWLAGILSSAFALHLVCQEQLSNRRLCLGALLMGAGVSAMHYTGMAAMRMNPAIQYDRGLVGLSVAIAVVASGAALWLAFRLREHSSRVKLLRAGSAAVMGCAIAGMHYTAMAAARMPANSVCHASNSGMDALWMAALVIISTLGGLSVVLLTSVIDMRLESRTAVLAASLANANQELTYLALHDNLTKLPNRLLLEDRLNQVIQATRRTHRIFSVLFMDLDGFKAVNDAFGHHVGDSLLAEVAERIRGAIRVSDTLARIGGDEFVLLADLAEPTAAAGLADKLVRAVSLPYRIADHEIRISVSIGIALYENFDQEAVEVLRNADAAMYHAKALGRNGYCFFEASMNTDAHEQLQLLQELRTALERQEMVLHYQPKFDARSASLIGVEALLRWQHPVHGLLPPDQFIPLAERSGMIVLLDEWVLNEACRQMGEWRAQGYSGWSVAVNLSPLQFSHAGLIELVRRVLDRYSLEPRCLILEITESTAMQDTSASMVILQKLSDMGVKISIDDFGTGYSSLLYLKRLPATELKIDRGFVRDLAPDTEDAAIVSAIVALGRTLNLNIVAEGIETRAQQDFLTGIGCTSLQGFLLGRPMPAAALLASVRAAEAQAAAKSAARNGAGQQIRWIEKELSALQALPQPG